MSLMLFPDPTLRSPTAVPGAVPMQIVMHQFKLEEGASFYELVRDDTAIRAIAAMSESDLTACLKFDFRVGPQVQIPLNYLAHLWPKRMPLELPFMYDRDDRIAVTAFGASALVVLFGVRK